MPLTGTLRSWDDERGFGFIAPTQGGREVFVHISAFPRDGSRPTVGERLSYELGRGADDRPHAVDVVRLAIGRRTPASAPPSETRRPGANWLGLIVLMACVGGIGAYAYDGWAKRRHRLALAEQPVEPSPADDAARPHWPTAPPLPSPAAPATPATERPVTPPAAPPATLAPPPPAAAVPNQPPTSASFRCDGRIYCSQMSSCAEATWFINHCPGTKMDGDHDGVPCESQWCTGPGAP